MRAALPLFGLLAACLLHAAGCRTGSAWKPGLASQPLGERVAALDPGKRDQTRQQASEIDLAQYEEPSPRDRTPPLIPGAAEREDTDRLELPQGIAGDPPAEAIPPPRLLPPVDATPGAPTLQQVVDSVRLNFPQIQEAAASRIIASGEALSASGAFDRKLDGFSNVQPLDFFENHWYVWKLERNTLWGGKVGAGYKLGRGSFEPWFLERETNDGGELSLSLSAPIGRDRLIDANRAELWRAQLERGRVEPFIRSQVLRSVRDGKLAYWGWVAAGANLTISEELLELAIGRTALLERQVEEGEKAKIELVDNKRVVLSRSAKRVDAQRKLRESAIKLSLFLRSIDGAPLVVPETAARDDFPNANSEQPDNVAVEEDVQTALAARPELLELGVIRRQLGVQLRQARNETRPDVDAGLFLGQDVGNPTSSDNKSDFELEGTLTVSVPLERRKARGKIRQLRGKLVSLQAKTQFASDKIAAEVRSAHAALAAAARRVEQTTEGVRLARQIVDAERRLYDAGQSTLFNLNLREGQVAAAAAEQIAAQFDYFAALAVLDAARGLDTPDESLPPPPPR